MGLYIVRRDSWYSERLVWGIAGAVILIGTVLAIEVHPAFVGLVTVTGLFSWLTASTGYCVMSSLLVSLGVKSHLGEVRSTGWGPSVYRMRTDRWFLERGIYAVVGTTQTVASVLAVVHHPGWLGFTGFVGAMAIAFAWSGFCPVANALYFLGLEPRLAPGAVDRGVHLTA